jgi:ribosomal protein L37AE/L43A
MNVVISRKIKRMLRRLAFCPQCERPATLIVDPTGIIAWSCKACVQKAKAALGEGRP